ncbi:MAG: LysR substrate-binding domain-containing protein [Geminicoccaceae bacterium]|nr:LysR substrate-binding domain-containing protein [Geminicoccaceae bacterium]
MAFAVSLRDLSYLVAVAETGQFGEAARRCHVSQPTLSMQLKKLEERFGAALFERGPRGAVPTPLGERVIAQAKIVLREVARLEELARGDGDPFAGPLRLGVIPTSGPYLLPLVLPGLKQAYPRLRLVLREATTARLLVQLAQGELDAAILSPPFDGRGLASAPIGREAIVVALPPGHPLAARARLEPRELAGEPLILLEDGHCFRDQALRLSERLGLSPHAEVRASSIESLRQMVSAGTGPALLPAFATLGPFAQGAPIAVRPLDHPEAARGLALVWRKSSPLGAAFTELAGELRALLAAVASRSESRVRTEQDPSAAE